jgi:hypothetical protein
MPTIARLGTYRVFFFSNERLEPPHVHIQREKSLAKYWREAISLVSATGFSARELRKLEQLATENQPGWLEAWHEFFSRRNSPESS